MAELSEKTKNRLRKKGYAEEEITAAETLISPAVEERAALIQKLKEAENSRKTNH